MSFETIPQKILQAGIDRGEADAYAVRHAGGWVTTSWRGYAEEIKAAARGLIALGVEVGSPVAILGANAPEWVIFDVAAMAVGAMPAGIYPTSTPDECAYVLEHSSSPVVLVQNEDQLAKILEIWGDLPTLNHIVLMRGASSDAEGVLTWDEFIEQGVGVQGNGVEDRLAALGPRDGATLIYTSGTTGRPKAVVLPHEALVSTAEAIKSFIDVGMSDSALSYLPLSHIAEQIVSIHTPAVMGHTIYYEPDIYRLAESLKEVRPTAFFAVPRVWEKFYAAVSEKLDEASGVKAAIANRALTVGREHTAALDRGEQPGGLLGAQFGLFDKLVYSKAKEAMGLDRCRFMFSSAAPLSPRIAEYFSGLGMQILQLYGQSECTGICAFNEPDRNRIGSVGPALPCAELSIAEDGEILTRGSSVFLGYLHNDEATAEALGEDGWLKTGDVGHIDDDGFLFITDRKKDIIITAGGENVTPSLIETAMQTNPLIATVVVIGDQRPFLTALVSVDPEAAEGMSATDIREVVQGALDDVNADAARVRQLKKFVILDEPLSIEHGELTPTLKVKRKVVREHFAGEIEGMYS
ncbi:MAG: long-chain fatty acid--CoA ligase [Actinomycetota bacterium]|nr:long-chain fatty acid--CoA ligase [Actinomycetota bacterium]